MSKSTNRTTRRFLPARRLLGHAIDATPTLMMCALPGATLVAFGCGWPWFSVGFVLLALVLAAETGEERGW